jgi:hypothetical protein
MYASGNTIQDMARRCKALLGAGVEDFGYAAIVLLVGVSAFGLGRISALEAARPAVAILEAPVLTQPQGMASGGLVVASRSGSVYYFPWCGGAGNISTQNQRWFKSEEAARAAGYRPAKNCKGLGQ